MIYIELVDSPLAYPFHQCTLLAYGQLLDVCIFFKHSDRLAKPTKEIGEVLRRLSGLAFTMEYKYDGERAQVHLIEEPIRSGMSFFTFAVLVGISTDASFAWMT